MKIFRTFIVIAWLIVALVCITLGMTDRAIFAMLWAIFAQLNRIEIKDIRIEEVAPLESWVKEFNKK